LKTQVELTLAGVGGYTSEVISASGEIRAQSVTAPTRYLIQHSY
jgi:hypothetical protein